MWGGDEGEKCKNNNADTGDGGGIGGGKRLWIYRALPCPGKVNRDTMVSC
jgi:hypothetical protein